jgi:hypothetical protein
MNVRSGAMWWGLAGVAVAALLILPSALGGDDDGAAGFDGHIQSGTCALPSDELVVDLESEDGANDVEPYVAASEEGEPVTLGYYGAPGVPGFGLAAIYTDQQFSMVITDPDTDDSVACGDILRPDADRFGEAGLAVVQLLPVGSSDVGGAAAIERATLERELDITPTRVQIILSTDNISEPAEATAGYEGYVQSGQCESPLEDVRIQLKSQDEYDVTPFQAVSAGSGAPVTVAYYGSPRAPGFGLAAAYTDEHFSVVIADPVSGEPVACGDILEASADEFVEAGLALVQLLPTGDPGVQGYAVVDRLPMQREFDVTPTLIRILLFAPSTTNV